MQASGNNIVDNSPRSSQATRGERRLLRPLAFIRKALQRWIGKLKMRILTMVICLRPSEKIRPASLSEVSNSGSQLSSRGLNLCSTDQSAREFPDVVQSQPSVSPKSPTPSNAGGSVTPLGDALKNDSEAGNKPSLQNNEGAIDPVVKPVAEKRIARCLVLQGYPGDKGNLECLPRIKRNKYPAGHREDVRVSCFPCCRKPPEVDLEELNRLLREKKARERAINLIAWKKEELERDKRLAVRCRTSLGLYSIRDVGQIIGHGLDAFIWAPPEVMLYNFNPATHECITAAYAKRPKLHWAMQKPILEDETLWRNSLRAYYKIRKKTSAHHFNKHVGREGEPKSSKQAVSEGTNVFQGPVKYLPASDKRSSPDASSGLHDFNGIPDYETLSRGYNPGHVLPTRNEGSAPEGSSKLSRQGPTFEHQGKNVKRFGTAMRQLHRQLQIVRASKYDGSGRLRVDNVHYNDREPSPSSFPGQPRSSGRQAHEKPWSMGKTYKVSGPSFDSRVHAAGHVPYPHSFSVSRSLSPPSPEAHQSPRQFHIDHQCEMVPHTPHVLQDKVHFDMYSGQPVTDGTAKPSCKLQSAIRKKLSPVNVKKQLREGKRKESSEKPLAKRIILRPQKRGGTPDITVKKLYLVRDTPRNKGKARRSPKARVQLKPKASRIFYEQRGAKTEDGTSNSQKGNKKEDPSTLTKEIPSEPSQFGKVNSDMPPGNEASQVKGEQVERVTQKPPDQERFIMPYDLDAVAAQQKDEPVIVMNVDSSTMGPIINKSFADRESKGSQTSQDESRGFEETNLSKDRKAKDTQPPKAPSSKSSDTGISQSDKPAIEREQMDKIRTKAALRNQEVGHKSSFSRGSYTKSSFLAGDLAYSQALEKSGTDPIQPPKFILKRPGMKDEITQVDFQTEETLDLWGQVSPANQIPSRRGIHISEKDEQIQPSSQSALAKQENSDLYLRPVARPSLNDNGVPFSKPGLYQVLEPPEDAAGGKVLATCLTKRASITEETSPEPSLKDPASASSDTSASTERTVSFSSDPAELSNDETSTSDENADDTEDLHLRHGRVRRRDRKSRVIVRSSLILGGIKDFGQGNQPVRSSRILDRIEDDLDEETSAKRRSSQIRIHSFLKSMAQRSRSVELNNLILQELARNPGLLEGLGYSEERKSSLSTMSSDDAEEGNHPRTPASDISNRSSVSTSENTTSANREPLTEATTSTPFHLTSTGGESSLTVDARRSPNRVEDSEHSSGSSSRQRVIEISRSSKQISAGSNSGSLLSERSESLSEERSANTPGDDEERNRSLFSSHNEEDSGDRSMPERRSRVIMRSSIILGDIKDNGPGKRPVRSSRILDLSGNEDFEQERYKRKRSSNVRIHSFLHSATQRGKSVELNNLILQELAKSPDLRDRITLQYDSEERKSTLSAVSSSMDNDSEGGKSNVPARSTTSINYAKDANEGNGSGTSAIETSRTSKSPSESLTSMDRGSRTSRPVLDSEIFANHNLSLSTEIPQTKLFQSSDGEDFDLQHVGERSQTPGAVVPTDPQNSLLEQAKSPRHGRMHSILQAMIAQSRSAESGKTDEVSDGTNEGHQSGQLEMRNAASSSTSGNAGNQILELPTTRSEHKKIHSPFHSMTSGSSMGADNLISSQGDRDPQESEQPTSTSEYQHQIVTPSLASAQETTSQADEMNLDSDALTSSQPTTPRCADEYESLALSAHQIDASSEKSWESKPPGWMEKWRSDRFADFPPAPLPTVSRNDGEDSPPPTPSSGPPSTPPHQLEFIQAFWNKNT